MAFARANFFPAGGPSFQQLLDYLQALPARCIGEGQSAIAALSHEVGLSSFGELLRNPLVEAWLNGEKWHRTPAKEALPLQKGPSISRFGFGDSLPPRGGVEAK